MTKFQKTSDSHRLNLIIPAKRDRFQIVSRLAKGWRFAVGINCCFRAAYQRLKEAGFKSYRLYAYLSIAFWILMNLCGHFLVRELAWGWMNTFQVTHRRIVSYQRWGSIFLLVSFLCQIFAYSHRRQCWSSTIFCSLMKNPPLLLFLITWRESILEFSIPNGYPLLHIIKERSSVRFVSDRQLSDPRETSTFFE